MVNENGKSKAVEPKVFRFEKVDDAVEGKLVAIREGAFGNGVYDVETKKGVLTVYGTKVLDGEIKPEYVDKRIRIVYRGERVGRKGFAYKVFEASLNGKRRGG